MTIRYLGHSAFYLEGEGFRALIDPFITGNPRCPATLAEFKDLTHLLITHGHSDHIGDAVQLAHLSGATLYCNHELAHYFRSQGVRRIHGMHIGGRFQNIKMTPALHGSSIEHDGKLLEGGTAGGFLMEIDGIKVYHAGDTGLSMEMKLLRKEGIDLALLPVGSNYTMDWDDALRAVEMIRPKWMIPMHYDTFELIRLEREKLYIPKGIAVHFMEPGDEISFEARHKQLDL